MNRFKDLLTPFAVDAVTEVNSASNSSLCMSICKVYPPASLKSTGNTTNPASIDQPRPLPLWGHNPTRSSRSNSQCCSPKWRWGTRGSNWKCLHSLYTLWNSSYGLYKCPVGSFNWDPLDRIIKYGVITGYDNNFISLLPSTYVYF